MCMGPGEGRLCKQVIGSCCTVQQETPHLARSAKHGSTFAGVCCSPQTAAGWQLTG